MSEIVIWIVLALLLAVNAAAVIMVVLQLPGTWMLLLATGVGQLLTERIGWWVVGGLAAAAVLGEVLEFVASARGTSKAGGSRRATMFALVGGVIGAVVGTMVVPVAGTLIGACVLAGAGSYLGDRWAGRSHEQATEAGKGAAIGRLWGTVAKVAIAVIMWLVTAVAVFAG